ncbi:MAG TPA: glycosyltransferase family 4 protein [Planctomycetota bacterium]|nr:glycosyltransferase family 4 protein [Planctomycetota bacterium]
MAIVVPNLDALGGMERQAKLLADHLGARGIPVTIVTTSLEPSFALVPRTIRPCRERRGPIEIIRAPVFANWTPALGRRLADVVALWSLVRRRKRIGVIYAVQFTGVRHAAIAARVTGLPVAMKFACAGEYGDFALLAKESEADEIRGALGRVDRYVIISNEIEKEAEAAGLDPERFVRIRNGVDAKRFSPEGPRATLAGFEGRPVVLFVGRLDEQKRVGLLVRAFARVIVQAPEARLAVAGSGPALDECRALAQTLGIADRVAFLGARADVEALQRAASVFVLPSVSEGIPNALLEALACGTPCVATDIPGTRDLVAHEREALLVPVDDVDALAGAIVRLLRDRELSMRLVAAGRARIESEFEIERVAEQYAALFSELAATPPRGASDLAIELRFARALLSRIAPLLLEIARIQARDAVTTVVVTIKRWLGIEGDMRARLR